MPLVVAPGLAAHVEAHSGWAVLVVEGGDQPDVERGLRLAARRVFSLAHPQEPGGAFPSYADARTGERGPELVLDVHDVAAFPGVADQLIGIVLACLDEAGVTGATLVAGGATERTAGETGDGGLEAPARGDAAAALVRRALEGFPWPAGTRETRWRAVAGGGATGQASCDGTVDAVLAHLEDALGPADYPVLFSADVATGGLPASGGGAGLVAFRRADLLGTFGARQAGPGSVRLWLELGGRAETTVAQALDGTVPLRWRRPPEGGTAAPA